MPANPPSHAAPREARQGWVGPVITQLIGRPAKGSKIAAAIEQPPSKLDILAREAVGAERRGGVCGIGWRSLTLYSACLVRERELSAFRFQALGAAALILRLPYKPIFLGHGKDRKVEWSNSTNTLRTGLTSRRWENYMYAVISVQRPCTCPRHHSSFSHQSQGVFGGARLAAWQSWSPMRKSTCTTA